jgi:hypothetical protein
MVSARSGRHSRGILIKVGPSIEEAIRSNSKIGVKTVQQLLRDFQALGARRVYLANVRVSAQGLRLDGGSPRQGQPYLSE